MTTEHDAVREAVRRPSAKDSVDRDRARGGTPNRPAFAHSGAVEQVKGRARQRSLRWMELGWDGTTTAAREEARKEAVLDVLRERRDQEAERLKGLRAEERMPHEVARP